jgi:hypothetical protein
MKYTIICWRGLSAFPTRTGGVESAIASLHIRLVLILGAVVLHVSVGVLNIARGLAMSTSAMLVETFFSTGAPGSDRSGALRTTRRAGARTGTFLVGMVCLLASRALVGGFLLSLALAAVTALLAVTLILSLIHI